MSKRILKMLVPVELSKPFRKDTSNINKFINKIPCDPSEVNKIPEAVSYAQEELQEYYLKQQAPAPSKREQFVKNQTNKKFLSDRETKLLKISLKFQKHISFIDLEELKMLLLELKNAEIRKHQKSLKMIKNKIMYTLQTERVEDHLMVSAKQVIQEIHKKLSRKIHQLF